MIEEENSIRNLFRRLIYGKPYRNNNSKSENQIKKESNDPQNSKLENEVNF